MIDLYEDHQSHRSRFEIIAFHDSSVKDFRELDKNLVKTKAAYWGGRDLPFPILLDSTGETIKTWGVQHFPTTVLIDPDGNLQGEADVQQLEHHLPRIPKQRIVQNSLNRQIDLTMEDPAFQNLMSQLKVAGDSLGVEINIESDAAKRAGLTEQTMVPIRLSARLSLRSWLELTLTPIGLEFEAGKSGIQIHIPQTPAPDHNPSIIQQQVAQHLESVLDNPVTFDFHNTPLSAVTAKLEALTGESFLVDPIARRAGNIDLKTPVTGSSKEVALRKTLTNLLQPAGLTYRVSCELILITPAGPGSASSQPK